MRRKPVTPISFWYALWILINAPLSLICGTLFRSRAISGKPVLLWASLLVIWLIASMGFVIWREERQQGGGK